MYAIRSYYDYGKSAIRFKRIKSAGWPIGSDKIGDHISSFSCKFPLISSKSRMGYQADNLNLVRTISMTVLGQQALGPLKRINNFIQVFIPTQSKSSFNLTC